MDDSRDETPHDESVNKINETLLSDTMNLDVLALQANQGSTLAKRPFSPPIKLQR